MVETRRDDESAAFGIEAVVFDLGGVLIDWNPRHLFRKLIADEARMEWFLAVVCSPAWNAEQDAGRSWDEAVAEAVARHPDQAELIRAYAERWPEMLGGDVPGTVAVLEALAARRVPLYALTNWSHETFHHARARFAWLARFQDIVVSGEVGMKKPDPRIFRLMRERIGVEPAAILFVDDVVDNVVSGREAGMRAIHFTSPSALRASPEIGALLGPA